MINLFYDVDIIHPSSGRGGEGVKTGIKDEQFESWQSPGSFSCDMTMIVLAVARVVQTPAMGPVDTPRLWST